VLAHVPLKSENADKGRFTSHAQTSGAGREGRKR
jgi:hypothetical protein